MYAQKIYRRLLHTEELRYGELRNLYRISRKALNYD
jgi:hypothetical protein